MEVRPGFPDVLSARAWVEGLGLEPGLAALVRFLGGWYVVLYDTLKREVMVGSELVWYTKNFLTGVRAGFVVPPAVCRAVADPGLRLAGRRADPGLGVCLVRCPRLLPGVVEVARQKCTRPHAVLLGIAFCGCWWSLGALPGRSCGGSGSAGAVSL